MRRNVRLIFEPPRNSRFKSYVAIIETSLILSFMMHGVHFVGFRSKYLLWCVTFATFSETAASRSMSYCRRRSLTGLRNTLFRGSCVVKEF